MGRFQLGANIDHQPPYLGGLVLNPDDNLINSGPARPDPGHVTLKPFERGSQVGHRWHRSGKIAQAKWTRIGPSVAATEQTDSL
ncbi:hypothetical protein J0H58_08255 [bacterium]|nr:hypothetical protein [bacterium]